MFYLLAVIGMVFVFIVIAALQRRFSSETLVNGFMDYEKGKEIAPTIFPSHTHELEEAKYDKGYKIIFTFKDNKTKVLDFKKHLKGENFGPLVDLSIFQNFQLDAEKKAVVWSNGAYLPYNLAYVFGKDI